jgi:hypothetical protein
MIDRLEKAQQTYNSELNYAYNDGKRAGFQERDQEIIQRMMELGMDEKQIAQIVGLPASGVSEVSAGA